VRSAAKARSPGCMAWICKPVINMTLLLFMPDVHHLPNW
jgi:hypothetical protein